MPNDYRAQDWYDANSPDISETLQARKAEVESLQKLTEQKGTAIPALYSLFYRFIQNPSSVSVDTFKRMVDTDDTVGSGVDFLTTCLAARLGKYQHPSDEITAWMNKQMAQLEGGWINKVKEWLSATWAGFFCGEKIWSNLDDGFVVRKVTPIPPTTVLFEVDRAGSLTDDGVLQYVKNWNPYGLSQGAGFFGGMMTAGAGFNIGGARPDPFARFGDLPFPLRAGNVLNYFCVRIPKMKVLHYSFDAQGKFDNPYGRSLLRRVFKYYVFKDTTLQQLSVALDRKGTPLTVVYASQHSTVLDKTKASRTQNNKGQDVGMRADVAAKEAFSKIHTDSVIVLPGKKGTIYEAESLTQEFNAETFLGTLDFCNKSIMRGLLLPSLIFTNGDGTGSYALGEQHAKTFDKICDGMLSGLEYVLLHQFVYEHLAYNFPRSAWEKDGLGTFGRRELSTDERDKELDVVDKAVNIGAIDLNDLSDLNTIREKAGFEPRDKPIPKPDPMMMGGEQGMEDGFDGKEQPDEAGKASRAQEIGGLLQKKTKLAAWDESKHHRAQDGKFGSGGGSGSEVHDSDKDAAIDSLAGGIKDKDWDAFMGDFEQALDSGSFARVTPEMAKKFYRSHTYTTESDPANESRKSKPSDRGKDVSDPSIAVFFEGKYYVLDGQHRLNTKIQKGEDARVLVMDGEFLKKYGVTKDYFSTKIYNSVDKEERPDESR